MSEGLHSGAADPKAAGHKGHKQQFQDMARARSEEHTSELQSHSFISYAVFCLKKKNKKKDKKNSDCQ